MANDLSPFWTPGNEITCHAGGAIIGKRLVKISGQPVGGNPQVVAATAGTGFAVAARDAASGSKVLVWRGSSVVPIKAGANLTAGTYVTSDGTGQIVAADLTVPTTAQVVAGQLLADVASGDDGIVALGFVPVPTAA